MNKFYSFTAIFVFVSMSLYYIMVPITEGLGYLPEYLPQGVIAFFFAMFLVVLVIIMFRKARD